LIAINQGNQSLLQQFAQVAEARAASGSGGQQDVLKAQTEQALLTNEGITLQQERRSAIARLNALLDRPVGQDLAVSSSATPSRLSLGVETLLALAEAHNPTLHAARARVEMAKAERSLARLDYLPDFSTRLEARQFNEQSRVREYDVMLAVNVPVWSWWKQRNAVREARAVLAATEAEWVGVRNDVAAMVQDRFAKADAAQRLVDLYRTSVLLKAEQALASARAGYEGGRVEFLSLLDAQRMLHETQEATEAATAALGQEVAWLEAVVGIALAEADDAIVSDGGASSGDAAVATGGGQRP
jgi:outer membrane protein TolC